MKKCLYKIHFFFLESILLFSIFFSKFIYSNCECGINQPILTANGCELKYCSKYQFDIGECKIDNSIIKTQWLNDIIVFNFDKLRYGSFTINSKGDMIYECSVEEAKGIRVFYWLNNDGSFFFKDSNGEKIPTKVITVKNNDGTFPIRYESQIISIFVNDIEYLISISLYTGMVELFDFENKIVYFVSTIDFTNYNIHSNLGTLIEIINGDSKQYLHTFIGQRKDDQKYQNFYLISLKYSFYNKNIYNNNNYNVEEKLNKRLDQHPRLVSSYITNSNIYIVFYLNFGYNSNYGNYYNNFVVDSYDINFQYKNTLTIGTIDGSYDYDYVGYFIKLFILKIILEHSLFIQKIQLMYRNLG